MEINELNRLLGNVDIYLLDQILKGRFTKEMKILDAGCGEGRNAVYFIQKGYQIFGIDPNDVAIQYCRFLTKSLNPDFDSHRFQIGKLESIPFHADAFDAVICSAVLHFAENVDNFWQMIQEINRVGLFLPDKRFERLGRENMLFLMDLIGFYFFQPMWISWKKSGFGF